MSAGSTHKPPQEETTWKGLEFTPRENSTANQERNDVAICRGRAFSLITHTRYTHAWLHIKSIGERALKYWA